MIIKEFKCIRLQSKHYSDAHLKGFLRHNKRTKGRSKMKDFFTSTLAPRLILGLFYSLLQIKCIFKSLWKRNKYIGFLWLGDQWHSSGLVLGQALFNIFDGVMDSETEWTLSKFANDSCEDNAFSGLNKRKKKWYSKAEGKTFINTAKLCTSRRK